MSIIHGQSRLRRERKEQCISGRFWVYTDRLLGVLNAKI